MIRFDGRTHSSGRDCKFERSSQELSMSSTVAASPVVTSYPFENVIATRDALRERMGVASQGAIDKEIAFIDPHARNFIEHSPFVCIATSDDQGRVDVSPKGDPAGFVKVLNQQTLLIPERPGNRRLDGFENILKNPRIGLLFFVPGRDETLRVNGKAMLIADPALLETMTWRDKVPTMATAVEVEELFFHCGKAFIRSKLWKPEKWGDVSDIATFGKILLDQTKATDTTAEQIDCYLEDAYKKTLY
jgi:PPOX class probable FMN-dependent enzyme